MSDEPKMTEEKRMREKHNGAPSVDLDAAKGLYHKFIVTRTDGSSRKGGKHEHCEYYVLDLNHDKHAIPALEAYAASCRAEYPQLADDLLDKVAEIKGERR